jgi:hypothetical protein
MKKQHSTVTDFSIPPCQGENTARLLVLMNHLQWLRTDATWLNFQRSLRVAATIPTAS